MIIEGNIDAVNTAAVVEILNSQETKLFPEININLRFELNNKEAENEKLKIKNELLNKSQLNNSKIQKHYEN